MRRLFLHLLLGSPTTPRVLEWIAIAILAMTGLTLVCAVAAVNLNPLQQTALACATAAAFLICNRISGRQMTLFLTMLSAVVRCATSSGASPRRSNSTRCRKAVLGTGLALAEVYAIIVLALGYIQTVWPLERKPVPLPPIRTIWPTVDVYVPTYNEDLSLVRATVLAAMAIDWPHDKLRVYILDDGRRQEFRDFADKLRLPATSSGPTTRTPRPATSITR